MLLLLMLVGFRTLLKRDRASTLAAGAVFTLLIGVILMADYPAWLAFVIGASLSAAYLFLLGRFGLLSLVATVFCGVLTGSFPLTLDTSRWWFGYSAALLALIFAIAAHGLHASLAGRPARSAP